MKVAFYLNNEKIYKTDFSDIEKGNPGVGGSEYLCVLIANELCKRNNIDTILLADKDSIFPKTLKYSVCGNLSNSLKRYHNIIDIFIIDSKLFNLKYAYEYPNTKFILWINNKMDFNTMKTCANINNIIKLVHVGREMYDLYRDTLIFPKTTYIYNAVSLKSLKYFSNLTPTIERDNNVVYIGSLVPSKGFHLLAKAWPIILKQVPDAELYVIGNGNLYNRDMELGNYGIAESSYEKQFMPYLTDNVGKILPSVHFLGIVGSEKNDILSKCKVGVPNPSGISETFGYTAVEMQIMGCAVTTKRCPGYIDTVYNTRNLYNSPSKLVNHIVNLLKSNNPVDNKSTIEYIIENFNINTVILQWEKLILGECRMYPPSSRSNYRHKRLKEAIRIAIPDYLKKYIPHIDFFYENKLYYKFKRIMQL